MVAESCEILFDPVPGVVHVDRANTLSRNAAGHRRLFDRDILLDNIRAMSGAENRIEQKAA